MKVMNTLSHDGNSLQYAISGVKEEKPWISLVIPFGLKLQMARYFFDFFESHYNIVAWESRLILENSDRNAEIEEFSLANHVMDLRTILASCQITSCILVGYCSGAGIALAAANRFPHLFKTLIFVHGEYTLLDNPACTTQFAKEIDSLLSLAAKDEKNLDLVFEKIKDDRIDKNSYRPEGIDLPFTDRRYLKRYSANYLAYKDNDYENLARYVPHKSFLMSGARDAQANVASSEKIKELIPDAEIYVDPEADHYGILREDSNTMVTIWNYLYDQRAYS